MHCHAGQPRNERYILPTRRTRLEGKHCCHGNHPSFVAPLTCLPWSAPSLPRDGCGRSGARDVTGQGHEVTLLDLDDA